MKPALYTVDLDLVPSATTLLYRCAITRRADGGSAEPFIIRGALCQTPGSAIKSSVDIVRYLRKEGMLYEDQ